MKSNYEIFRNAIERDNFLRAAETVVIRSNRGNGWALTTEDRNTDDMMEAVADMMVVIKHNRRLIKACLKNKAAISLWLILRGQGEEVTTSNGLVFKNVNDAVAEEQKWLDSDYYLFPWTAKERLHMIEKVMEWEKEKENIFEKEAN